MNVIFFLVTFILGVAFACGSMNILTNRTMVKPDTSNVIGAIVTAAISIFMFLESFSYIF